MYAIDPFRPVHLIVEDLRSRVEEDICLDIGRSAARAILEDEPAALLALSLAYCVVRGAKLDGRALADMVEVMIECEPAQPGGGRGNRSH